MERYGGDLETEADQQQADAGEQQRIVGGGTRERGFDRFELDRAGGAIDESDTVEQKAGGERAEQEVLERGFVGARVAAQEAGQRVNRDRHRLEA